MRFEIKESELTSDDLAPFDEMGSSYLISFFAMNKKVAIILFMHYYAHLITHQHTLENVGTTTMMEDAKKLIANMRLKHNASKKLSRS